MTILTCLVNSINFIFFPSIVSKDKLLEGLYEIEKAK